MPRKRALPVPADGSKLPRMVGAVIYVRVSNEGADRESQPADPASRLRGILPAPGLRGPRTLPRGRREREDHGSQPTPETAHILPPEQGPRPFRGRVQPDALRARQIRPLRATFPAAVARHFVAFSHGAD